MSSSAYQSVKLVQNVPLENKHGSNINRNNTNRHEDQLRIKTIDNTKRRYVLFSFAILLFFCITSAIIAIIYFLVLKDGLIIGEDVLVYSEQGRIRGRKVKSPQGGHVNEFLGIPFALPPTGELRYANPTPIVKLSPDPYPAIEYGNSCIQHIDSTFGEFSGSTMWNAPNTRSEDCLYLNVWTPSYPRTKHNNRLLPVMVWIYGGGFFSGTNALWVYDGKVLSSRGEVIVVSMNYRVGTFGYLSSGDGRIKGNFGMMDQVMALEWIQENIKYFGGDPKSVTLFGESSGASSADNYSFTNTIGLHMMSNISDSLFHRVIFESGSPDSHWAHMSQSQAKERSSLFFNNVRCTQTDTTDLLKCLRSLDSEMILNSEWVDGRFMVFPWAPTVDGTFLKDTPKQLLKEGKLQEKSSLLGVNMDEGTYWILYALKGFSKDHESPQNLSTFKNNLKSLMWDITEENQKKLIDLYLSKIDVMSPAESYRDATSMLCGDRSFTCPTWNLAKRLASKKNDKVRQYFYYLTRRATTEVWPDWMGVIHGAEIQWVFGMPMNVTRNYTQEEIQFSESIIDYWVNFARNGDPNSENLPDWPAFTSKDTRYLVMAEDFTTRNILRSDYCKLWTEIES